VGNVTLATRRAVLERDGHDCVCRGQLPGACGGHLDMGHIVNRQMGGGDGYDGPEWIVTMCRLHNNLCEDAVGDVRDLIRKLGMSLNKNHTALMPERARVRYPDGHYYTLNNDGTKERTPDAIPIW